MEAFEKKYQARITEHGELFHALIVRVDKEGEPTVLRGYPDRLFKTLKGAEKSTSNYINKLKKD